MRIDMNKKMSVKSVLMLVLTAFIWGVAFVAQSVGMSYIGPFTFNCVRLLLGGIVLIPCIWLLDRMGLGQKKAKDKNLLLGGVLCGIALGVASTLQQFGVKYTTVGKAGFITALYIVLVPVFGIFLKKKAGIKIWVSVLTGVAGLYLLCITDTFSIGKGDFYVLLCAVVFTVHILLIDYFSPKVDGIRMSCIQFFVAGLMTGTLMLIFEKPEFTAIKAAAAPVIYAGVLSCGVAYTLQIIAQKDADPTIASLILSLESVFSVLAGWAVLGQVLNRREVMGCVLMFGAIILAQLPERKRREIMEPN